MKIGVISDMHDNLVNLNKTLNWFTKNKIEKIICCGDVTNVETLKELSENFKGEIHLVRGNMEIFYDDEVAQFKNIIYHGRVARFKIGERSVGVCHEPFLFDDVSRLGEVDIIFYGHTHKPWIDDNKHLIVNPGTLGGVFQKSTFAIWDVEKNKMELKILENL